MTKNYFFSQNHRNILSTYFTIAGYSFFWNKSTPSFKPILQFLLAFCWLRALCVCCASRGCSSVCYVKFFMVSDLPYLLICKENACGFLALSLKVVKKELGIHKQAQGTGSQKRLSYWKTVAGTPCCTEKRGSWKSIRAFWITAAFKETHGGRNETVKEHVCASGGMWA